MSANYNKVILFGRVTKDVELKYTPKGTAIAKLGLAVNREWKTETGEKKSEATFVDIDFFGKSAEALGQYVKKGRSLLVEGRLKLDQFEDKNTHQKRSRLGVVGENWQFGDSNKEGGAPANRTQAPASQQARQPATPDDTSDVPF